MFRRLDAWGSIFGDDILQNPNIQNPNHPDGTKFRRRFRVPYFIFMSIVGMFRSREGWNPANSTDDIGADVGADVLDPRVVNLRRGPADHSYAGGGNLSVEDVQVESEWMSLRKNLVQHYMYCFRSNVIKW